MPRFVILQHETPPGYDRPTHFDLMFENDGVLWTWALTDLPTSKQATPADRLADHRPMYLDFEGPLTGNRGTVRRVDQGEFDWIEHTPGRYQIRIRGTQLHGLLMIEQDSSNLQRWRISLSD